MIKSILCVLGFHTMELNSMFDKYISGTKVGLGHKCKYCNKHYTEDYVVEILEKCNEINKKPRV